MIKESEKVLLLSGPQYFDERRPISGKVKRVLEHTDPLGIAIISAFLKEHGIETFYREMRPGKDTGLEKAIEASSGVFISARHYDLDLAKNAIGIANRHDKPSVVGGYAPTFLGSELQNATSRVYGEAEGLMHEIAEDFLRGKLKPEYDGRVIEPPDIHNDYTWPDRTIFPDWHGPLSGIRKYSQEWQRGCSNYCNFCSPTRLQRADVQNHERLARTRDPQDIIAEVESMDLKPGSHIMSVDLNTAAIPREELIEVFSYFRREGIRWYTEGTVSQLIKDAEEHGEEHSLLNLMSAREQTGGCYSFLYGADDLVAKKVGGSSDKERETLEKGIKLFRKFGIPLNLSLVVGLEDHYYPESFFQMAHAIEDLAPSYTFVHIATPYKGTVWGDKLYRDGRVFDTNSVHHNHRRVVFNPENMTAGELEQGYYWILRRLNSPGNIARIVRRNTDIGSFQRNAVLSTIQSGIPWSLETVAAIEEMQLRGFINKDVQARLDREYKSWKKTSAS